VNYRHLLSGDRKHIERWFIFSKTSTWKEKKTKIPLILKGNIIPLEAGSETPFAEEIIEFFIKRFTDEHDWVLDAYAGLGTLGLVATRLNRNAILYENNSKPWKTLCDRIAKVEKQ
jgi:DNA modification methylase